MLRTTELDVGESGPPWILTPKLARLQAKLVAKFSQSSEGHVFEHLEHVFKTCSMPGCFVHFLLFAFRRVDTHQRHYHSSVFSPTLYNTEMSSPPDILILGRLEVLSWLNITDLLSKPYFRKSGERGRRAS